MNFHLPATGKQQRPIFVSAIECQDWLVKVPLANAELVQTMVLRQLDLLHRFTLPPDERFAILEVLRSPIRDFQKRAGRIYAGKALPLLPPEQAALEITLCIWHRLALGYLRCLDAWCGEHDGAAPGLVADGTLVASTPDLAAKVATLAQRTLSIFADWQVDIYRGKQLPESAYWRKLHQIFLAAEALNITAHPVVDPVHHGRTPTSALAAYGECNLLSSANPYELEAHHLEWVTRWARRWGGKLVMLNRPPDDIRNRAVPLCVDLESDRPAGYVANSSNSGRWLETTALRKSLVTRIRLLEQGRSPAKLQLGVDVTQPTAGQLLRLVLQRWCNGETPRLHIRQAASVGCSVIVGLDAVHNYLSGCQAFRSPCSDYATLRRECAEFHVFGFRSHRSESAEDKDRGLVEKWVVMDDWRLLNESATGLCIARALKEGVRLGVGFLIAVKAKNRQGFTLGSVRWALRDGSNSLSVGIQMFPGEPRPVALRLVESDGMLGTWQQGFLLPRVNALHEPVSLVVAAGTFRIDQKIEVMVDHTLSVLKLSRVLDRGIEFERCSLFDYGPGL